MQRRITPLLSIVGLTVILGAPGCSGDDDDSAPPAPQQFVVTIENLSGSTSLATPFAPGVFVVHTAANPIFTAGEEDRGEGLEALAEDGSATMLATSLGATEFNTPMGASSPGPIASGGRYQFTFDVPSDTTSRLSLATMLVQSNDWFIGPGGDGIALFDASGEPITGDISDQMSLWDAGTEADEIAGAGLTQAPRQGMTPNVGRTEGSIGPAVFPTRAMPAASRVANITVTESSGTFTITVENVSMMRGDLLTPIAPVAWAIHDSSFTLFTEGMPDRGEGLEVLAEDGSPMVLATSLAGASGVESSGAQTTTVERPADPPGPAMPGERFTFDVIPSIDHPYLSFAAMVVESNDGFLAVNPGGVRLIDEMGQVRSAAEVQADIAATVAIWDAGTEANEVPGVGANQAIRQAPSGNIGPADPDNTVRLYRDTTNDFGGDEFASFADVTVTANGSGDFVVEVTNTSSASAFPGILTPIVWAIHADAAPLFTSGMPASDGLEAMAEDGVPDTLAAEIAAMTNVDSSGVMAMPVGASEGGPLMPGATYRFTVSPAATARYLSLFSMVVPSNDTFMALTPVALVDESGADRAPADIASDIADALGAWDAGTEANQVGAGGRDQAPRSAADTGASEAGVVNLINDGTLAPELGRLVRVTIDVQ